MRCTSCGSCHALGVVTLAENYHERICDDCADAWEGHRDRTLFRLLMLKDDGAGALHVFRTFQRERANPRRAA